MSSAMSSSISPDNSESTNSNASNIAGTDIANLYGVIDKDK